MCVCVPVCDGRFVSVPVSWYVLVQVGQTSGRGLSDDTELRPGEDVGLQVVAEGTLMQNKVRGHGEVTVRS